MYQITYPLPESKQAKNKLLKMDEDQAQLYQIIHKNFQGVPKMKIGNLQKLQERVQKRGYSTESINDILSGNWLRVFKRALPS
ncbi:hypothetical protein BH10BAC3_BH10BAC3_18190 [soil metagenome]